MLILSSLLAAVALILSCLAGYYHLVVIFLIVLSIPIAFLVGAVVRYGTEEAELPDPNDKLDDRFINEASNFYKK